MADPIVGDVSIVPSEGADSRIFLAPAGNQHVPKSAVLVFTADDGHLVIRPQQNAGGLSIVDTRGRTVARVNLGGLLTLGPAERGVLPGTIFLRDGQGKNSARLSGQASPGGPAQIAVGRGPDPANEQEGTAGEIILTDKTGLPTLVLNGQEGVVTVGSEQNAGQLEVVSSLGKGVTLNSLGRIDLGPEEKKVQADLPFGGVLNLRDHRGGRSVRIQADAPNGPTRAELTVGRGPGANEQLGTPGDIRVNDGEGVPVLDFHSADGRLSLGATGKSGSLVVRDDRGEQCFGVFPSELLDKGHRDEGVVVVSERLVVGRRGSGPELTPRDGEILLRDQSGMDVIRLVVDRESSPDMAPRAVLRVGSGPVGNGSGMTGVLSVLDSSGAEIARLDAGGVNIIDAFLTVSDNRRFPTVTIDGRSGRAMFGRGPKFFETSGKNGSLSVLNAAGEAVFAVSDTGTVAAKSASFEVRSPTVSVFGSDDTEILHFDTEPGSLRALTVGPVLGPMQQAQPVRIEVRDERGANSLEFDPSSAVLTIGRRRNSDHGVNTNPGRIDILGFNDTTTIRLDGGKGDVELLGADCAEEFDVRPGAHVESGSLMVVDNDGALHPCVCAYDPKVVGVISGAGSTTPGITLGKRGGEHRHPLALVGTVFCKVDARYAPVSTGDLLTTSPTVGHAMKASDPARAFGAVIGKALAPLEQDTGLIPILVALQ